MARNFLTSSRHGTVFYFRRRVPDDLRPIVGKPYLVKTLNISDRREAIVVARAYAGRTDEIFQQLRTMKKNKPDALQADYTITLELGDLGEPRSDLSRRLTGHAAIDFQQGTYLAAASIPMERAALLIIPANVRGRRPIPR